MAKTISATKSFTELKIELKQTPAQRANAERAKADAEEEAEAVAAKVQAKARAMHLEAADEDDAGVTTATIAAGALVKQEEWAQSPIPNQDINSVAISGDGSVVVAGTFFLNAPAGAAALTQTVGFFTRDASGNQVPAGNLGHTFDATAPKVPPADPQNPTKPKWTRGGILSVAISRDGAWAACGGGMTPATAVPANAGFIHTYEVATGNVHSLYIAGSEVRAVALSSDGTYLAAGADRVHVYRRTGTTWAELPLPTPDPIAGPVRRVSISGDGRWIVAAVDGGIVGLLRNDLQAGTLDASGTWALPAPPPGSELDYYYVQSVAAAEGGAAFAAGAADGKCYYFDTAEVTEGPVGTLTFAPRWGRKILSCPTCRWVDMSDDGVLLAAIGAVDWAVDRKRPGRVVLYRDKGTKTPKREWQVPTIDGPNCVSIDSDGTYVAVADGTPKQARGGFYLFDGTDGTSLWTSNANPPGSYPTQFMNYAIALSADGNAVVGGSNDGSIYYFLAP